MAQIPIYTAEATSPRPRTPSYIPEGGLGEAQQRLAQSTAQIGKTGEVWADINQRIQEQHNDNETIELAGKYNGGIAAITNAVDTDPEIKDQPQLYTQKFNAGVEKLVSELNKGASNDAVRARFMNHVNQTLPKHLSDADKVGKQRLVIKEKAAHIQNLDNMSTVAASPDTAPNISQSIMNVAKDQIDRAYTRGFYKDEVERDKAIKKWEEDVLKKNMTLVGERGLKSSSEDLYDLRENMKDGKYNKLEENDRLNIYDKLEKQEEQLKNRRKAELHDMKTKVYQGFSTLAVNKGMAQSDIDEIKAGAWLPYVTPEEGVHLEKVQNATETNEGSNSAVEIMTRWASSMQTYADTEQARIELKKLGEDLAKDGKSNKLLVQYGSQLGNRRDELKNQEIRAKNMDIQLGVNKLTAEKPTPSIIPFRARQDAAESQKWIDRLKVLMSDDREAGTKGMNFGAAKRQIDKEKQEEYDRFRKGNPNGPPSAPYIQRNQTQENIDKALGRD